MENNINLEFDNKLIGLAGYEYGEYIFSSQVDNKMNIDKINNIIFPERIEAITLSFIKGFTKTLRRKYGIKKTIELINIVGDKRVVIKSNAILEMLQ